MWVVLTRRLLFTLIELLVVVSIIMVLASLLLPSLQRAKQAAHTISCASNERQYAFATFNFANDYNDYLPCVAFAGKKSGYEDQLFPPEDGLTTTNCMWSTNNSSSNLFWPYFGPFFWKTLCPSHPSLDAFKKYALWQSPNTYILSDGGYGHYSGWTAGSGCSRNKRTLASRPHPSSLFMVLEREDYPWINTNSFSDKIFQYSWGTYQTKAMGYHHNNFNGFNACFFDGHVKFYKLSHSPLSETDGGMVSDNWR